MAWPLKTYCSYRPNKTSVAAPRIMVHRTAALKYINRVSLFNRVMVAYQISMGTWCRPKTIQSRKVQFQR